MCKHADTAMLCAIDLGGELYHAEYGVPYGVEAIGNVLKLDARVGGTA